MTWKDCLALSLIFLAGCRDSVSSRLSVGQKVIAIGHDEECERVYLYRCSNGLNPGLVRGTHLTVVDDEAAREHDWATRDVEVHVEDGESRGLSGVLTRWDLRPE